MRTKRRSPLLSSLRVALVAVAAAVALPAAAAPDGDGGGDRRPRAHDVLLVHGAWVDASSWSGVIQELQQDGFTVRAVQLPLQGLDSDVALVRRAIDRVQRTTR